MQSGLVRSCNGLKTEAPRWIAGALRFGMCVEGSHALAALSLGTSCSSTDPAAPVNPQTNRLSMFDTGRITVRVYWADQGIPGKKVEVLELGKIKTTDENGIAVFRVPVGTFTARVYDVQRAGPPLLYVDTKVTVTADGDVRVDVWECLPCV